MCHNVLCVFSDELECHPSLWYEVFVEMTLSLIRRVSSILLFSFSVYLTFVCLSIPQVSSI